MKTNELGEVNVRLWKNAGILSDGLRFKTWAPSRADKSLILFGSHFVYM